MATIIDIDTEDTARPSFSFPKTAESPVLRGVLAVLKVLASLKITVVLFAMAIFIVFAGTLAQTRHDIWDVVHTYFRSAFVWIPFQIFFPKSFFPESAYPMLAEVPGKMPFFGGWAIGAMMAVNLLAAHVVRFKAQAKGSRLLLGLAVVAAGCLVTAGVIVGGSESGGLAPLLGPSMRILWQLVQGTFAGLVLLAGCRIVFGKRAGIVLLHSGVGLMMFSELLVGTTAIESQMHIVEGDTVNFVQDIRTNELAIIDSSDPDKDTVVVIPRSFLKKDSLIKNADHGDLPCDIQVVQYFQNSLLEPVKSGEKNLATAGPGLALVAVEKPPSTGVSSDSKVDDSAAYVELFKKGTSESLGTYLVSQMQSLWNESRVRSGLSDSELRARTGPFILKLSEPTLVTIDGKQYQLALRFKRTYKPYSLKLHDVRAEKYLGTETPKDYSSIVHLTKETSDPAERVDRDGVKIWMNNPLRFDGETFYQSSVGADPVTQEESTGLQVVTNTGWMIPYVSCMIVGVGLLYQFSIALLRFLKRREAALVTDYGAGRRQRAVLGMAGTHPAADELPFEVASLVPWGTMLDKLLVGGLLACCAAMTAWMALPPRIPEGSLDLYEAGKIPIIDGGRVKPLDTLARNTLQVISNRETFKDNDGKKSRPAIHWLFDVISGSPAAERHHVFRVDSLKVLARLGLEPRDGFLYSLAEIRTKVDDFNADVEKAHEKAPDKMDDYDRKLVELDRRIRAFTAIDASFRMPDFGSIGDEDRARLRRSRKMIEAKLTEEENRLKRGHPPLAVPVRIGEGRIGEGRTQDGSAVHFEWKPLVSAATREFLDVKVFEERQPDAATEAWRSILQAYAKDSPHDFHKAVANYQALLAQEAPPELASAHVNFEAFFNNFSPFFVAWLLYIFGFVISALAWLGWSRPLNRAAFWMSVFTLCLHTFALVARIYISGRPPVTNLYSSAVFIGWGCVVLGLVFEMIFRMGIGNVLSEVAGFATLFISFKLAADGDTFTVLQAVLDTQFWLATHVTCVTLGYATTFLAGLLGVLYIIRTTAIPVMLSWLQFRRKQRFIALLLATHTMSPEVQKDLTRMTYGTLCFAIFFSFVGTVLGGLWADDSWGRFWGWDPKENGALMIVLWNALVLHARWDGIVKDRGLAVLAVGGNIITAWSWFGVNELGVGLHSYGFTAGVLQALGIFIASQLIVVALGLLPKAMWNSDRPTVPLA